jgi:PmbA protein
MPMTPRARRKLTTTSRRTSKPVTRHSVKSIESPWPDGEMLALGDTALLKARSKGAEEAEVYLGWGTETSVDIEGGRLSCLSTVSVSGISIRVLRRKKVGFAYCTDTEKLGAAIERAIDISSVGKELEFHFPDKATYPKPRQVVDENIMGLSVDDGVRHSLEMMDAASGVKRGIQVTSGGVEFGNSESAILNSQGAAVSERSTGISGGVSVILKGRTPSTGSEYRSSRMNDLDFEKIGTIAAKQAADGQNPKSCDTGQLPVIFTPDAFSNLLGVATIPALIGEAIHRHESVYDGKLGELIATPSLTMIDDGLMPGGLATSASDDEGIPSRRTVLIERGILKGFLYDTYSASEFGKASTSSATRGTYRVPPDTGARNIIVEGADRPLDALISEMGEGLVVHEVLGAHTANPVSGDFSVSSSLLFSVHKGELSGALKPVMLSGNFPALLGTVTGMGRDRKKVAGYPAVVTGSVRFEGLMVTGEK